MKSRIYAGEIEGVVAAETRVESGGVLRREVAAGGRETIILNNQDRGVGDDRQTIGRRAGRIRVGSKSAPAVAANSVSPIESYRCKKTLYGIDIFGAGEAALAVGNQATGAHKEEAVGIIARHGEGVIAAETGVGKGPVARRRGRGETASAAGGHSKCEQ